MFQKSDRFGRWDLGPVLNHQKRNEFVLIAHLHIRIVKIQQVGQSARILPIHVKELLYSRKWQAKVTRINTPFFFIFFLLYKAP